MYTSQDCLNGNHDDCDDAYCECACHPDEGRSEPCPWPERIPSLQPSLFAPMCAASVAVQQTLFHPDPPRASGPRVPDLPGQTFLEDYL